VRGKERGGHPSTSDSRGGSPRIWWEAKRGKIYSGRDAKTNKIVTLEIEKGKRLLAFRRQFYPKRT